MMVRCVKRISPALVAVLLGACCAPRAIAAEDAIAEEDRRILADALFSRNMFAGAAKEYARLVRDFPDGPNRDMVYFRYGEALRLSGNKEEAAKQFKAVIDMGDVPFRHRAAFKRAAVFLEMNWSEDAADLFSELLAEKPTGEIKELALYYYGESLVRCERFAEAVAQLEQLLKEFPKSDMTGYAKLSLGRLYATDSDATKAVRNPARSKALLQSVVDNPGSPRLGAEALFMLARAAFTAQNYKESADCFKKLETKYPDDERVPESRLQTAWAYMNAGMYSDALRRCDEALALPDLATDERCEFLYIRASCHFQLLRYDEAASNYLDVVAAKPEGVFAEKALYQAGLAYYRGGKYDACAKTLERIDRASALRQDVLWLTAEAFAAKNDTDFAVQYYRMLVTEFPDSPYAVDALYRLGHQLQLRKSWQEASAFFLQLAERFPDAELAPKALFASASALSSARQGAQALRDWEEYLKRFPNDEGVPEALFQKALEEIRLERKTEALTTFDSLMQKFPKTVRTSDAQFWRAQLLREKGSLKDAEKAFREVLTLNPKDDVLRETRFSLAMTLQQDGREDEAVKIFQELIDDPIRSKFTATQFAWLSEQQFDKGDFKAAEETAHRMLEQTDNAEWRQTAWTLIGRALRAQSKPADAKAAYLSALDENAATRYVAESTLRVAEIALEQGDVDDADKYFRLAVERCAAPELQPMRIYAYTGLGRTALAKGNTDDAARYLMTVCVLYADPKLIPPIMLETIELLEKLERADDAAALKNDLLTQYPESGEAAKILERAEEAK